MRKNSNHGSYFKEQFYFFKAVVIFMKAVFFFFFFYIDTFFSFDFKVLFLEYL